ncbi:hypothetical protein ACFQ0B_18745 [Nonomuraea thailandensis]
MRWGRRSPRPAWNGAAHEHRAVARDGGIFRIAPPLTISEDELHAGVDILEASLKSVVA